MDTKRNWDEWLKQNIHLCTGIWIHLIHSSFTYCHFVENLCNGSDHHIIIPTYLPHIFCLHAYKIKKMVSFFFFLKEPVFFWDQENLCLLTFLQIQFFSKIQVMFVSPFQNQNLSFQNQILKIFPKSKHDLRT